LPPLQIANPSGYVTELEKQNQSSERQPAASATEQTPEQPNIAEAVAQYAALGGPLGGGFAAPPVDTNVPGYDWTAPFRERVFEGPRGGRTRRQGQHQDTHFLQPRRHAGVSAALARNFIQPSNTK
jgi:hypothetical protein